MGLISAKSKVLWGIGMIGLLGVVYWICRFVFFDMYGMKQWPNLLAVMGIVFIVIAITIRNLITPIATVVGYIVGFILAMIFNTDRLDPGGGKTNNAWLIWGLVFIISIVIGIIMSVIQKRKYETA